MGPFPLGPERAPCSLFALSTLDGELLRLVATAQSMAAPDPLRARAVSRIKPLQIGAGRAEALRRSSLRTLESTVARGVTESAESKP